MWFATGSLASFLFDATDESTLPTTKKTSHSTQVTNALSARGATSYVLEYADVVHTLRCHFLPQPNCQRSVSQLAFRIGENTHSISRLVSRQWPFSVFFEVIFLDPLASDFGPRRGPIGSLRVSELYRLRCGLQPTPKNTCDNVNHCVVSETDISGYATTGSLVVLFLPKNSKNQSP